MALRKSMLMREYENIRKILRNVYIYGCFSRDDFIEMGYSGRKYDKEQQRLNAYLPNNFLYSIRRKRKVYLCCKYNIKDSNRNMLAETYRNKSFTKLDILSYFFIQQSLSDGKELTLMEILSELPCGNESVEFTKDNLRVKLDELAEIELIQIKKIGRNIKYKMAEDIWKDFIDQELEDVWVYLEFLKNTVSLEMPYYYLQRKLEIYMEVERNQIMNKKPIFQMKHNHMYQVLDNDILKTCLEAIQQQYIIQIRKENKKLDITFETLPIKIIQDMTYGRQYLLCYYLNERVVTPVRIDKIKEVKITKKQTKEEKEIVRKEADICDRCWCTSISGKLDTEVVVNFIFDEIKESYILNRIKREGHGGIINKIEKGVYQYKITISDPNEMIPWIRSFGERAVVVSSGEYSIEDVLVNDWTKAVEKYEIFS